MGTLQGFTTSYFTPEIPHPTTVLVPDINLRVHGCRIRDDTNPWVTSYFTPEIPHPTTVLVPDINLRVHGCRIRDDTNPWVTSYFTPDPSSDNRLVPEEYMVVGFGMTRAPGSGRGEEAASRPICCL
jgi:hypothetical protein